MRRLKVKIQEIKKVQKNIYKIRLNSSYLAKISKPGQFIHLKIEGPFMLRRPISIHSVKNSSVYLLFRVKGEGTKALSFLNKNSVLDIVGPLGNGFEYASKIKNYQQQILIAAGIGAAPMFYLAEKISKKTKEQNNLIVLAAKTKKELLCEKEFKALGFKVAVATDDASKGFKGTAVDLLSKLMSKDKRSKAIYACGPDVMFKSLYKKIIVKDKKIDCQISYEQFMGCGVGVCSACAVPTDQGYKRACKEGPVFDIKRIKFD